jgi:hypothetical protein
MDTPTDLSTPEISERVRQIRGRLPGQMRGERMEEARLRYGTLYTLAEIRRKVADTLPWRPGYLRSATLVPIEEYASAIPAEALLKYDDAVSTGLFSRFLVATPRYYETPQTDPWIVAEVIGTDRLAVIAYWA